jgi:hypothetical protein
MKIKRLKFLAAALIMALAALNSCKKDDPVPVIKITAQIVAPGELTEGSIPADTKLEVKATVTEGATLTYQWYANTSAGNTGGTAISGATLSTYTIPTDIKAGTYYYFCEVSAPGAKAVRSSVAAVTVTKPAPVISISKQPEGPGDLYEGQIPDSVRLTVEATVTEGAALKYQWHRFNPENDELFEAIEGATSAVYKIPAGLEAGEYLYVCDISAEGAASVQTDPVIVTVLLSNPDPGKLTLSSSSVSLTVGSSATLTVTNGEGETFTWESSNPSVATVDQNGKVTAVGAGSAVITVTTGDGKEASCTVKVLNISSSAPTYKIEASELPAFGTLHIPYTQPEPQTVTVTNTGTGTVTLAQPAAVNYIVGTLSPLVLAPGSKATFTVQPKPGLPAERYQETIQIQGSDGAATSVTADFTVRPQKTVSVGAQTGTLEAGRGGTATFAVTTEHIDDGTYTAEIDDLPEGVSMDSEMVIEDNNGTLTLSGDNNIAEGTTELWLTLGGVKQTGTFRLTVVKNNLVEYNPIPGDEERW